MKKKFLSLLLALAMCLSLCIPAWAEAFDLPFDEKYNYLLSSGFPENFLDNLDEYSIEYLYNESQENYLVYGGSSIVTGGGDGNIVPFALVNPVISPTTVNDGSFDITSSYVIAYNSDRVTVNYYTIFVNYEWTSPPSQHLADGFVSNWPAEHLTFKSGTFRYRPYYKTESATSWTLDTANQTSSTDRLTQGGLGVLFDLKDPPNSSTQYLYKGTFYYSLNKVVPDSDDINVTVNSIYAHKWQTANMEITFTIEGPAVTFTPGSFYQPEAVSVSFQF